MRSTLFGSLLVLTAVLAAARPRDAVPVVPPAEFVRPPTVKLAVLVVFDQMRGDYVAKWRDHFPPGGFRRMQEDGAWFDNCHYPYATTLTGVGHASMLSGTVPAKHGIIGNDWYDRKAAANVYCATAERYENIPYTKPEDPKKKTLGGAPTRMLAETVGDTLKRATGGRAKVFGLSLKDRSALLPVGQKPDGAYWFNAGQFVTSTHYRDAPHLWVRAFNRSKAADQWYGTPWTKSRPDLDYTALTGPDKVKGEGGGKGQGSEFPHATDGGKKSLSRDYYEALANSPFGNDLLLDFAELCVVAEGLGKGPVPDLLTVSFSSNDLIGHTWGPDSQEVLDITLRSDRQLAALLAFLDDTVGEGEYIVALTADHGVCPMPEAAAAKGLDAKRVTFGATQTALEQHLEKTFGPPPVKGKDGKPGKWIETISGNWIYLNDRQLVAAKRDRVEVSAAAAKFLATQPIITAAYGVTDMAAGTPPRDAMHARVRASYFPARSGDVYFVLKPYYLSSDPVKGSGSTHGSPHPYDTHVPLLVFGPNLNPGTHPEPVTPQAAAAILSFALGIDPPKQADYPVPPGLFRE